MQSIGKMKFSLALACWPESKSYIASVWESGRVVSLLDDKEKEVEQVKGKNESIKLAKEIVDICYPSLVVGCKLYDTGSSLLVGAGVGPKWNLIIEFWAELKRGRTYPALSFRVYRGGVAGPDPSRVLVPLPGQDKPAEAVYSEELALSIASRILQSARWSINNQFFKAFGGAPGVGSNSGGAAEDLAPAGLVESEPLD
jgi:hypothetical protein